MTTPKSHKENTIAKPRKENTAPNPRKENTAPKPRKENSAPKPRKEKWDMPVSRKFYTKLQQRVSSLHWNTDMPLPSLAILLDYMEDYVMTRRAPDRYSADHYAYLIFVTIRPEIDDALRRSEACRERAAERRARKLAALEACRAIMPGDCRAIASDTPCIPGISDACTAIACGGHPAAACAPPYTASAPDTPCIPGASATCTAIACGGRPSAANTACGDHPSVSPDQSPAVAVGKNKTPVPSRPLVPLIPGSITACDDPTTREIASNHPAPRKITRVHTNDHPTPRKIIEIAPYPGYDLRDGVYYRRPDTFLRNRTPSVWAPPPLPQNFVDT